MNTLYISDLDGTLLNKNAELSKETIDSLNRLIKEGVQFSCATARTPATVSPILKDVSLSVPAVLMNGVLVYDLSKKEYVKVEYLNQDAFSEILAQIHEAKVEAFVYSIHGNILQTYYEHLTTPCMQHFYQERLEKFQKPFAKVDNFDQLDKKDVIYTLFLNSKEVLDPIYEKIVELQKFYDIDVSYYLDVYGENVYCMEVYSNKASKYNAVNYLRQQYHYDRIIGFGDNLNDLPLFQACDEAYAVENARAQVRAAANKVIESNEENGVVHFIEQHSKLPS